MPEKARAAAPVIIAVDGPVAAGKGTLARRLAEHFGLRYLDSGSLYRAVASRLLRTGGDPADTAAAAARALTDADREAPDLRDERVGQTASVVAAIPEVRAALLDYQRAFAAEPPGAVVDGRDIGTVVFPDATHKLFVTAGLETRVARRYNELVERGAGGDRARVKRDLVARDRRDSARGIAPLAAAADAVVMDTTELDADAVFEAALAALEGRR
ncbi:MAG: (d)CMP kinase [Proteobacteria bacterium]|nr:(d)CMP kinase [Pseudomonadota bacterium]